MYTINIKRKSKNGELTFKGPKKSLTTKCYWDSDNKIPAGTYKRCSATTMARKLNSKGKPREAIFIPNVEGYTGIFIHMGKSPYTNWSDGCIVIDEDKIIEIYNAVTPKNAHNVKVVISEDSE